MTRMVWVLRFIILTFAAVIYCMPAWAEKPLPRTIYALYDEEGTEIRNTNIHQFAEMPLNYLGYNLEYHNVNKPLPAFNDSVAAVILWFTPGTQIDNPDALLDWLEESFKQDKKLILFGDLGIGEKYRNEPKGLERIRKVLRHIGVEDSDKWSNITYEASIVYENPAITKLERRYGGSYPSYLHITTYGEDAESHLKIQNYDTEGIRFVSDLIITNPNGGYVSQHYVKFEIYQDNDASKIRQWYINPFAFFSKVLNADALPKPDVTTINGKRIFYSHMDGDGWNSLTEVEGYNERKTIAADILRQEIFARYTDLPFSVSVIVDEMKVGCYGMPDSIAVAKRIFALPNVEPSSHTYSHPLYWQFFEDGDIMKEKPFLAYYPARPQTASSIYSALSNWVKEEDEDAWNITSDKPVDPHAHTHENVAPFTNSSDYLEKITQGATHDMYETPRSYACAPFDINQEIVGSVNYIQDLVPKGKKVKLVQWSGNTRPFEKALAIGRENGILNINGGDTRLDREYPSYSYVAPIGAQVGKERQIYSSNSNENTYTNLWTDRFFGFRFLTRTVNNTDTPIRISPFNVYFHTYSGTKKPSLEAIRINLDYAKTQDIIPVFTSEYAEIANAFYHTDIVPIGENQWRIDNRKSLQTIRFDHATLKTVDWKRSAGVIGQYYLQGSLYVSLDPAIDQPVIALNNLEVVDLPVKAEHPYLIKSRWKIKDLQNFNNLLTFKAEGFGTGAMQWYWPGSRTVSVKIEKDDEVLSDNDVTVGEDGLLTFDPNVDAMSMVNITITPKEPSGM